MGTATSLLTTSILFPFYGLYAQRRVKRIFWTGTAWRNQIFRQVNQMVCLCIFFSFIRMSILVLLLLEKNHWTNSTDHYPFLWFLCSDIIPYYGLAFILFRWSCLKRKLEKFSVSTTRVSESKSLRTSISASSQMWVRSESRIIPLLSSAERNYAF